MMRVWSSWIGIFHYWKSLASEWVFSLYSTILLHFIIIIVVVVLLLSLSYCSRIYWSSFYGNYFAFGFSSCQVLASILRLLGAVSMDLKDKPQLTWIKLTNTLHTAQIVTRLCGFNFNFPSVSDWFGQCIGVLYAKYLITSIMVVILQFSCKGLYGRPNVGEYISHSEVSSIVCSSFSPPLHFLHCRNIYVCVCTESFLLHSLNVYFAALISGLGVWLDFQFCFGASQITIWEKKERICLVVLLTIVLWIIMNLCIWKMLHGLLGSYLNGFTW